MSLKRSNHIPCRTCAGCLGKYPKTEMRRVILSGPGTVQYDPQQTMPGRGTYVCKKEECISLLIRKNGFDRAFRQPIDRKSVNKILEEWQHE